MEDLEKNKLLRADCFLGYILLTCGTVFSLLALWLAYKKKPEAKDTIYNSHFDWQIRTFWIAFPYFLISLVLAAGLLTGLFPYSLWLVILLSVIWVVLVIWWVARILYGVVNLQKGLAV